MAGVQSQRHKRESSGSSGEGSSSALGPPNYANWEALNGDCGSEAANAAFHKIGNLRLDDESSTASPAQPMQCQDISFSARPQSTVPGEPRFLTPDGLDWQSGSGYTEGSISISEVSCRPSVQESDEIRYSRGLRSVSAARAQGDDAGPDA